MEERIRLAAQAYVDIVSARGDVDAPPNTPAMVTAAARLGEVAETPADLITAGVLLVQFLLDGFPDRDEAIVALRERIEASAAVH